MAKRRRNASRVVNDAEHLGDWRSIRDDREKYQAYLCSREWAEKREAVRRRAEGVCERCRALPMSAVHHLTYARKYNEPLEDLQAICQQCHDFTHGKDDFDPARWTSILEWLVSCKKRNVPPMPYELMAGIMSHFDLNFVCQDILKGAQICWAAELGIACDKLLSTLPFDVPQFFFWHPLGFDPNGTSVCYRITGFSNSASPGWFKSNDEKDS